MKICNIGDTETEENTEEKYIIQYYSDFENRWIVWGSHPDDKTLLITSFFQDKRDYVRNAKFQIFKTKVYNKRTATLVSDSSKYL